MPSVPELDVLVSTLRGAGCVAAEKRRRSNSRPRQGAAAPRSTTSSHIECAGEPLAWITGRSAFCGRTILVDPGVYVPRWQSESLARAASAALGERGIAVDLCTGAGPIAVVLAAEHPSASVLATDVDPLAVACARRNGVDARLGDLTDPLPEGLRGLVDVITAVAPYVPTGAHHLLSDDARHEPVRALDGGADGLDHVRRVVTAAATWLRTGGWLGVEAGTDQCDDVRGLSWPRASSTEVLEDADGDRRGVVARLGTRGEGAWPRAPRV